MHAKPSEDADWKKLGFVSLEDNKSTGYQARQLRTANIKDAPAVYLRFTIMSNHENSHNPFAQVGIISLCVYGDRIDPRSLADPLTPIDADRAAAQRIKELEQQKKKAADDQDFDKANAIKKEIQKLKNAGRQLLELEELKKEAVRKENYDQAKLINQKIKKLRDGSGGGPNFTMHPSGVSGDLVKLQGKTQDLTSPSPHQNNHVANDNLMIASNPRKSVSKPMSPNNGAFLEDRPLDTKKNQVKGGMGGFTQDRPLDNKKTSMGAYPDQDEEKPQPGLSVNVQKLTREAQQECRPYFQFIDEPVFELLYSTNPTDREEGANRLHKLLRTNNSKEALMGFLFAVKLMIDDKNSNVLASIIDFFAELMRKYKPVSSEQLRSLTEPILEKLADYVGHTAQKPKAAADAVYTNLPSYNLTSKDACYRYLCALGKRDKPQKVVVGRLKVLNCIVRDYQLGADADAVITYGIKYAQDKSAQVRGEATSLLGAIAAQIGFQQLQPSLAELKPAIIKSIEDKSQGGTGGVSKMNTMKSAAPPMAQGRGQPSIKVLAPPTPQNQDDDHEENQFMTGTAKSKFSVIQPTVARARAPNTCQFCERTNPKFAKQDYKDVHMYFACPMLTVCPQCDQCIEISLLNTHQLSECKNSGYKKKCPRCREAVSQRNYKAHLDSKECTPAKPMGQGNRCPLCHYDTDPGVAGWKAHLLEQGCQANPRK